MNPNDQQTINYVQCESCTFELSDNIVEQNTINRNWMESKIAISPLNVNLSTAESYH